MNVHFAGAAYAFTRADILFDPVLETEDVVLEQHTFAASYIRSFELLARAARIDLVVPYQQARWEGLLRGMPAAVTRQGFADPVVRFAVNVAGAPPLDASAFARYQAEHPVQTIVGAGVAVQLPLGAYDRDKLLNLGENRFVVRPALGIVHSHGKWSGEVTGSVWLFSDNDDFFGGSKREQDPLPMVQGHLIHTFRPGLWASASAGYARGGATTVNGVAKNDTRDNLGWAFSFGYPFSRRAGMKIAYIQTETREDIGADTATALSAVSVLW